jgi:hypothetical protein
MYEKIHSFIDFSVNYVDPQWICDIVGRQKHSPQNCTVLGSGAGLPVWGFAFVSF